MPLDPESLSKAQLHSLAARLLVHDREALEDCIDFVLAETRGNWHGRARAMMCRRLKSREMDREMRARLTSCIIGRLNTGNFSEQFRDQLRLALSLDRRAVLDAASLNLSVSPKDHVRRYSAWVLRHYGGQC